MTGSIDKERLHINVARLKKAGENYEVVIDPEKAIAFRKGKIDIGEVLQSEHVFFDAKKGELASQNRMKEIFKTEDPLKVAEIILKQGEIQLTSSFRAKLREEKERQLIAHIHRNAFDPKTGYPHPPERIRNAMIEAKVHVREDRSVDEQLADVIKAINRIIPISMDLRRLELLIPGSYAGKCYSIVRSMASIRSESWQGDGSWLGRIEVPAGLQQELLDKLNNITHGNLTSKIME